MFCLAKRAWLLIAPISPVHTFTCRATSDLLKNENVMVPGLQLCFFLQWSKGPHKCRIVPFNPCQFEYSAEVGKQRLTSFFFSQLSVDAIGERSRNVPQHSLHFHPQRPKWTRSFECWIQIDEILLASQHLWGRIVCIQLTHDNGILHPGIPSILLRTRMRGSTCGWIKLLSTRIVQGFQSQIERLYTSQN